MQMFNKDQRVNNWVTFILVLKQMIDAYPVGLLGELATGVRRLRPFVAEGAVLGVALVGGGLALESLSLSMICSKLNKN